MSSKTTELLHTTSPFVLQDISPPLNFDTFEDLLLLIFFAATLQAFSFAINAATLA